MVFSDPTVSVGLTCRKTVVFRRFTRTQIELLASDASLIGCYQPRGAVPAGARANKSRGCGAPSTACDLGTPPSAQQSASARHAAGVCEIPQT